MPSTTITDVRTIASTSPTRTTPSRSTSKHSASRSSSTPITATMRCIRAVAAPGASTFNRAPRRRGRDGRGRDTGIRPSVFPTPRRSTPRCWSEA